MLYSIPITNRRTEMARVTTIKSARAVSRPRSCTRCGTPITAGVTYHVVEKREGRSGVRLPFCFDHYPRPSDRASGRTAEYLRAQEEFEDGLDTVITVGDIEPLLTALAGQVEELADGFEESASGIEDGLGHATTQSERMTEIAGDLRDWASNLQSLSLDEEDEDDPESHEDTPEDALTTARDALADASEVSL